MNDRHILASTLRIFLNWERWILLAFGFAFFISFSVLLVRFYYGNTMLVPAKGGTYIEGSVGELQPLIPWFIVANDVNRDIVSLVFSGLLKYDPESKAIEEDLATLRVSEDGRMYTIRLKDDLMWHDSTSENPHPVTADDIVFTFQTIQQPGFPNTLLRQNFQGVDIRKVDEKTVQFRLEEPYRFFSSNLTLGLLPKRSFEDIPPHLLDRALDFGFHPIGAGPYRFKSLVNTDLSVEVTLERISRPIPPIVHLDRVVFRIFPDYTTLLSDIQNLDGIRNVSRNRDGEPVIPRGFRAQNYSLPQYVALFLNLDRPVLQDTKLRLGLQLGTEKRSIVNAVGESVIVDTPLLEIDVSDWRYQFDPQAAQGALFESEWYLPEKLRLQQLLEKREANEVGHLRLAPIAFLETGSVLTITGSYAEVPRGSILNGISLTDHPQKEGGWVVGLPTHGGTGSIRLGDNLIRLIDRDGKVIDSYYLWRTTNAEQYRRAAEEQRLVDMFVGSRDGAVPPGQRITAGNLFLENGFLRLRTAKDPIGVRVNKHGDRLVFTLLTSPSPPQYRAVAEHIRDQWRALGVDVRVHVAETQKDFRDRMLQRDYDVLLFGQSLLDNLDSYPYWHSSGAQKITGGKKDVRLDAYNLSQYASFKADTMLETIRKVSKMREREEALSGLRETIKRDVPAIFLYSPLYTFAYREEILGVTLGSLSLHSDRFLTLPKWYVKQDRVFRPGENWWSFLPWLLGFLQTENGVNSPVDGKEGVP